MIDVPLFGRTTPPEWMSPICLLHCLIASAKELLVCPRPHLYRSTEGISRMSVLRVIPIDELSHPYSGMSGTHESSRILDGIFHGLEKRFNEGIVVADPRS